MARFSVGIPVLSGVLLALGAPCVAAQDDAKPAPKELPRPYLAVLNKAEATVSLIDPRDGTEHRLIQVGEGPHEAAVSGDGGLLVVCNYGARSPGGTLTVIRTSDGETQRTIDLLRVFEEDGESKQSRLLRPHGIQFIDANRVVVTSEVRQQLAFVDVVEGEVEAVAPTEASGSHMVAVDDERAYVANIGSGSVSVVDLANRSLVKVVETGAGSEGIAVRPDGREVWVTNRAADTVSVIDVETLEVLATLDVKESEDDHGFPIRVAFTPDGSKALISCASAGRVEIWDVEAREKMRSIEMDEEPIDDAEGERLFSGQFGESPVPVGVLVSLDGREAFVANTQADVITVLDLQELRIARRLVTRTEPDGMAWIRP
ncbi:MAG: cytochrome D1 domain-containing protein [Planctomycetota bacterium]